MRNENAENLLFDSEDEELVSPPKKTENFEITPAEAATRKVYCKPCGRVHLLLMCPGKIIN